jgi:hypothetical protein
MYRLITTRIPFFAPDGLQYKAVCFPPNKHGGGDGNFIEISGFSIGIRYIVTDCQCKDKPFDKDNIYFIEE